MVDHSCCEDHNPSLPPPPNLAAALLLEHFGDPPEGRRVAHLVDQGHHKDLDGSPIGSHGAGVLTPPAAVVVVGCGELEELSEFFVGARGGNVDLVPEDRERYVPQGLGLEQVLELDFGLAHTGPVRGVHQKNNRVHVGIVVCESSFVKGCGYVVKENISIQDVRRSSTSFWLFRVVTVDSSCFRGKTDFLFFGSTKHFRVVGYFHRRVCYGLISLIGGHVRKTIKIGAMFITDDTTRLRLNAKNG